MKLIIVIVRDEDNDRISNALTEESFRVTFIASTGGFLRSGRSTLLVGVDDDRVERALEIIRGQFPQSKQDKQQKRATIFVLNVSEFEQI